MKFFRYSTRSIALLEVLISFALIVLCVLPLIAPHVFILKGEKEFVHKVELDHLVHLLYANRLEKLYQNKISWDEIKQGREMAVDAALMEESGFGRKAIPFRGTYRFIEEKHKKSPDQASQEKAVYLFSLVFTFIDNKNKKLEYPYLITIERRHK